MFTKNRIIGLIIVGFFGVILLGGLKFASSAFSNGREFQRERIAQNRSQPSNSDNRESNSADDTDSTKDKNESRKENSQSDRRNNGRDGGRNGGRGRGFSGPRFGFFYPLVVLVLLFLLLKRYIWDDNNMTMASFNSSLGTAAASVKDAFTNQDEKSPPSEDEQVNDGETSDTADEEPEK